MKKVLLLVVAGLMIFSLAGCQTQAVDEVTPPLVEEPKISGTLEEIVENIYGGTELELPQTMITELNEENEAYFLGNTDVNYVKAIASEPMMSSVAHSLVLLQVEEGADIESLKTTIKENVDPRKWICVGVEDDEVIVDHVGDIVVLIMSHDAETLHESFKALAE
ncbi:hypothetical protein SANA_20990 [Gottschalkiaceae bacterium SANA]|nr:hypothetical protein SANA_20990 [Gottschalkiaceae bacterium SANA]